MESKQTKSHEGRIESRAIGVACVILSLILFSVAQAHTPVKVLKTNIQGNQPADSDIIKTVRAHINTQKYREVRVQLIRTCAGVPSHYLVYLLSKNSHKVGFAKIVLDQHFAVVSVEQDYQLQPLDLAQQPGKISSDGYDPCRQN